MKKWSQIAKAFLAISIAALFVVSCANPFAGAPGANLAGSKSLQDSVGSQSATLWAGQNIDAGTVTVSRDASNLYVVYQTNEKYLIGGVHVWVGTDLSALPTNNNGIPVPGQFPKNLPQSTPTSEVVVTVPLAQGWTTGTTLYIFAHADLLGQNVNSVQYGDETGWAGDKSLNVSRWNFYFTYTLPAYEPPAPPTVQNTATYSISGTVFRDLNANGDLDNGETGLSGVTVTLSNGATVSTDANGVYSFSGLPAGNYTVTAGSLTGYYATPYGAPVTSSQVTLPESKSNVNFGLSYETVAGVAFYDANKDGVYQDGEPLLSGIQVQLSNGTTVSTASDGSYSFDHLPGATTYTVSVTAPDGFVYSYNASATVTPAGGSPALANFGFALDYSWILGKTANGYTIGYWKTNIDKALANSTKGIQVSKATLLSYQSFLSNFALAPLNIQSLNEATTILSATSSNPIDLLKKQLMASEFNYVSGAYISGNQMVTYFFVYDGEYMLNNAGSFTSTQLLAQKDKYDIYNNSHGVNPIFF